ncbi:hypothetical protein B9Z35_06095 [Limnohabitans sp. Jir61]|uniref:DUF1800 domain-containing protein n=1 Tax=Limnohabitans sp. Jir61 TaxID=1826168 RepID=UPI000D334DC8|nr:DUF1800 domain-containing protein [Limnohabitans sp. Jir61]PUE33089.1 hypothetical protein B9Z35_06095 [Limnohabitans sp. Jir61]
MSNSLLERITFGANQSEVQDFSRLGPSRWIQKQLNPTRDDPSLGSALDKAVLRISYSASTASAPEFEALNENRSLSLLNQSTEQLWPLTDNKRKIAYQERTRPVAEATASKLLHARYSQWQLRELMVDFWQNHFNVHAGDISVAVGMPEFDADLRRLALGNFQELLTKVAKSTPMLVYLNNRSSKTGAPNENFARELFELHTLGRTNYLNDLYSRWREVPGALQGKPSGYIDQDVYEAARAFTGWTVEDGRGIGSGLSLPSTGKFTYLDAWHDPYQKRVLAQEFEPYQAAMADGQRVLDMLSNHSGTAQYICEKFCRRFVSDQPPAQLVASAAKVWMANAKSSQQIAHVLEHILLSEELQTGLKSAKHKKLKRPLELAISFMRKLDLELAPSQGLVNQISNAGQRLYYWPTPDGHPDVNSYWLTSHAIRQRWFLPVGLLDNWWGTGFVGTEKLLNVSGFSATHEGLLEALSKRLLGESSQVSLRQVRGAQKLEVTTGLLSQSQDEWNGIRRTLAYLAMSPQFQWK